MHSTVRHSLWQELLESRSPPISTVSARTSRREVLPTGPTILPGSASMSCRMTRLLHLTESVAQLCYSGFLAAAGPMGNLCKRLCVCTAGAGDSHTPVNDVGLIAAMKVFGRARAVPLPRAMPAPLTATAQRACGALQAAQQKPTPWGSHHHPLPRQHALRPAGAWRLDGAAQRSQQLGRTIAQRELVSTLARYSLKPAISCAELQGPCHAFTAAVTPCSCGH